MGDEFNSMEITSSQESLLFPSEELNFNSLWEICTKSQHMLPSNIEQNDEIVPSVGNFQDLNSNPICPEYQNIPSTSGTQNVNLNQLFEEVDRLLPCSDIQGIDPMIWRDDGRNVFMNTLIEDMSWGMPVEYECPGFIEASKEQQNTLDHQAFFQGAKHNQPQLVVSNSMVQQETASCNQISSTSSHVQVSSSASRAPSSLPASKTWPGQYDFTVSFSHQEKITKGVPYIYSETKDKLYVKKDAACAVNFSANSILPDDVSIRVMALYTAPEQVSEIVHRCLNHSMEEINNGVREAEHLIRSESSAASYHVDSITHRHSVVVPFENPPVGQHYSTFIYKFACFGSCAGGPNRRPLMLIFTLEKDNQVIGRRKLDVKICACPGRDKKLEEAQLNLESNSHLPAKRKEPESVEVSEVVVYAKPPVKSAKTSSSKEIHTILMKDLAGYEFLLSMKRFYEISKAMKGADVTKTLRYYNRKNNEENSD